MKKLFWLLILFASVARAQYEPVNLSWTNFPAAPANCSGPVTFTVFVAPGPVGPFHVQAVTTNTSLTGIAVPYAVSYFIVEMHCGLVGLIATSGITKWVGN